MMKLMEKKVKEAKEPATSTERKKAMIEHLWKICEAIAYGFEEYDAVLSKVVGPWSLPQRKGLGHCNRQLPSRNPKRMSAWGERGRRSAGGSMPV